MAKLKAMVEAYLQDQDYQQETWAKATITTSSKIVFNNPKARLNLICINIALRNYKPNKEPIIMSNNTLHRNKKQVIIHNNNQLVNKTTTFTKLRI